MVYRKIILQNFDMDVNHFLGIPSLAFNLMLKISKVKLELISDPEINTFFGNPLEERYHLLPHVMQNQTIVTLPLKTVKNK